MESIDIYDNLGQKSGKIEDKDEVHKKALIHKGVCVWIMNSKQEILLQTRSSHAESVAELTDILRMRLMTCFFIERIFL